MPTDFSLMMDGIKRIIDITNTELVEKLFNNNVYSKFKKEEDDEHNLFSQAYYGNYLHSTSEYIFENYEVILRKRGIVINVSM